MGTRARIAVKNDDGSYTSIYTHWGGDSHGPTLRDHYADPVKVAQLMALGDLSVLGPEIGVKHDWANCPEDQCNAYDRDRGESGVEAERSVNFTALRALTQQIGGEYLYVFDGRVWWVGGGASSMFGMPANKPVSELALVPPDAAADDETSGEKS